jgi:hypothetical protein
MEAASRPTLPPHTQLWQTVRAAFPELAKADNRRLPPDAPPPADLDLAVLLLGTAVRYPWYAEAMVAVLADPMIRLLRAFLESQG